MYVCYPLIPYGLPYHLITFTSVVHWKTQEEKEKNNINHDFERSCEKQQNKRVRNYLHKFNNYYLLIIISSVFCLCDLCFAFAISVGTACFGLFVMCITYNWYICIVKAIYKIKGYYLLLYRFAYCVVCIKINPAFFLLKSSLFYGNKYP